MPDLSGHIIGRYRIRRSLGIGGMAAVYLAFDQTLEREVAVKVIQREAFPPVLLDQGLKRFEREAKALARLSHPNIVHIYDYGEYQGDPFLVMEFLPRGTLARRLGRPVPWRDATRTLLPVLRALVYAHGLKIIHRDIKPSNILFTRDEQPMLADFGLVKILAERAETTLTGTGLTMGTPEYMAPEQASTKTADQRADIYSIGVILYEMVTGRRPFRGNTPMSVMIKHANDPLPDPRQFVRDLPDEFVRILSKALAKKPAERFQTAGELIRALEAAAAAPVPAKEEIRRKDDAPTEVETLPDQATLAEETFQPKAASLPPTVREGGRRRTALRLFLGLANIAGIGVLAAHFLGILPDILPATPASISTDGLTLIRPKDQAAMNRVPAGIFDMGTSSSGPTIDAQQSGIPNNLIHPVQLDEYWIDRTEVTNGMYARCVGAGACPMPVTLSTTGGVAYYDNPVYADFPVVYVTWYNADAYCRWTGARLPTEAEWEKSARGNDLRTYPWGWDPPTVLLANAGDQNGRPAKAGSYPRGAGPFGTLDLAGNVAEWVSDRYSATYYNEFGMLPVNPPGPDLGLYRALRGGSFRSPPDDLRAYTRNWASPDTSRDDLGFRCAVSDPPAWTT